MRAFLWAVLVLVPAPAIADGGFTACQDATAKYLFDLGPKPSCVLTPQDERELEAAMTLMLQRSPIPSPAPAAVPSPCSEDSIRTAARALKAANPGLDNLTLGLALQQRQELLGCIARQPVAPAPTTTRCNWEGYGIARQWVCRTD